MPKKIFKAEEIVQHLRTAEIEQSKGVSLEDAARKIGISPGTLSRWRREYGGLRVDQARRLKELEQENLRLKKIVGNLSLDNLILKEVNSGNF